MQTQDERRPLSLLPYLYYQSQQKKLVGATELHKPYGKFPLRGSTRKDRHYLKKEVWKCGGKELEEPSFSYGACA